MTPLERLALLTRRVADWVRRGGSRPSTPARRPARGSTSRPGTYPGDFPGLPPMQWSPSDDDRPDPGEVVWAWVPYEEDHSRGKDRPVLLVGRDGPWLLSLPMTSKDHDRDAAQEERAGRLWCDVGRGPWDAQGRPSEVRTNRVVRVDPARVRRIGAVLDRERFDRVARAVRAGR